MNYFKPGLREFSRKLGRQKDRLRTVMARRRLAQVETELGLLGWQQAEFDAATQAQVDKINEFEREQSRLNNESAGLGKELRELREQRETARKAFEEQRRALEAQRYSVGGDHPQIEKQLAEKRKLEPAFERRMPELERELRGISKLYSELLRREPMTAQVKQELTHLRERTVAIPNEKSDLRNQHLRTVSEIRTLETQLERDRKFIADVERQRRELQQEFDEADGRLAGEIRSREREKVKIEREINHLEAAKVNPYQRIGRVLADSGIAPMNQPGSLEKVMRARAKVTEIEHVVSLSQQASALENRQLVHLSWFLWAILCLVTGMMIIAFLPR